MLRKYIKYNINPISWLFTIYLLMLGTNAYSQVVYEEIIEIVEVKPNKKTYFALKTNLLFDAITALNVEIEVPIKKHWSIAGEWIFPWWLHDKDKPNIKPSRLEILCGTLEGRYWFGNRDNRPILTGWFVGLFSGAGLYDLQWKAKGYQGEFFISAGASIGFAHKIGKRAKHLSMEYSIGFGHFRSHYRKYEAYYFDDYKWHPIRENNGRYTWTGPTRIKISLVWMPPFKVKRGGNK